MKTKTKKPMKQYRQGDVLIERVASLPSPLTKAALEQGRVILAHGEVTGHAHSFAGPEVEKFTDAGGAEYFEVRGTAFDLSLPIVRRWNRQVMVRHPQEGLIEFALDDVKIAGDQVRIKGNFALLRHDEHSAHGIPAGLYRGGGAGAKVRQREYTPEAIRNVAD